MSHDADAPPVIHNADQKRFEIRIGPELAIAEYMLAGRNIIFTHTEVPPALEGQGLGNRLAKFALDYAVAQGYKIQPLCPFIAAYVRRHEEYQPHVWHT
ncbi:MAG: N-acetyltransferase [Anaerolineae bacterium]|jgi:predicted GNAT family acetyltransferase|nr:N-acetyltransferase [Anaerolineae bacterium]